MLSSILNRFSRLSVEYDPSFDVEICKVNSPPPATSWISSITDEDSLSVTKPNFSNQILITNCVLTTPKVVDHSKKRKCEHVNPKRVAKKDMDYMTKTEKNEEKSSIKNICKHSKHINLSEK